jgi:hypothetical protein
MFKICVLSSSSSRFYSKYFFFLSIYAYSISVKKIVQNGLFILIFLNYNNIYIYIYIYIILFICISQTPYPMFFNERRIAVSDTRRIRYSYRVRASLLTHIFFLLLLNLSLILQINILLTIL